MRIKYFTLTFMSILIYTFCVQILTIEGFSIFKIAYTAIAWLIVFISAKYFVEKFNLIKNKYGKTTTYLLTCLLFWNTILVVRSVFNDPNDIITILGNEETSLALMVPLVVGFSVDRNNVKLFYSYAFKYIFVLVIAVFLFLIVERSESYYSGISYLFAPLYFLIPISLFNSKRNKILIYVSSVILLFISIYYSESRSTALRVILLYLVLLGGKYFALYKNKITYKVYILIVIIPLIGIYLSVVGGESVIKYGLDNYHTEEIGPDTRTFLYIELYEQLSTSDDLLLGRGANGRYYSSYFADISQGDFHNRLTVEVGWLWLLLRGGFVSVFFYSLIFLIAIYKAFHDSNNKFIKALAWIIVVHYLLSFIQNIVYMDIYNYLAWFTVGITLNRDIRYLNDNQIKKYLLK